MQAVSIAYSGSVQVFHWLNPVSLFLMLQRTQNAQDSTDILQRVLAAVKPPVFMDSNCSKSILRDLPSEVSAFDFS